MAATTTSILQTLSKARLIELGRAFSAAVPASGSKDEQVSALVQSGTVRFRELLSALGRDELKAACRAHQLDESGRARTALAARLLQAHGATETAPPKPLFSPNLAPRYAPRAGDIVTVRHRQWLVAAVAPPTAEGDATRVSLVCLDDDNQGRALQVLWELELGAKVHQPEAHGLGEITRLDPPRHFAAYLHALKWNSVTASDAKLFQAPFRAGIALMSHQLTPLAKALALPRANIFIADDVGLGKTIEAGLVAQELLLRQRIDLIVIVCPASVCLQWKDEMQKRFGLHFEIVSRAFVSRRRQERGFGVNPWSTHTRFIVSQQVLRRPEYREPLLAHLGERSHKSLLILDEAHAAAPAAASRYATDSNITKVIRDIAPRFENRLFLSATPHNGHSNSFSALLEILDPQRFTRGVPVKSSKQLDHVMVRRLKEDLRQLGRGQFPKRTLVSHPVGEPGDAELVLADKLAEYTKLMKPGRGQGALVFINLQKRLLSSVAAFGRTLEAHQRRLLEGTAKTKLQLPLGGLAADDSADDDEYGVDDETSDANDEAQAFAASADLSPNAAAAKLLGDMVSLARQARGAADAKVRALLAFIQAEQCPGVQLGGASSKATKAQRAWSGTRIIIFTEYGDTKNYLRNLLSAAIAGTDRDDERIELLHGGMSDEERARVQRAFNSPPDAHPVRILIATDAAREGVNLQGHCADLFHFDLPWNPGRIEQRNGRIDRALQPSPEVRCHYFLYQDRPEDIVLGHLVKKVDTIQRELGSIGSVLLDRMTQALERGIDESTQAKLLAAEEAKGLKKTASAELEGVRLDEARLRDEIEEAEKVLNRSKKIMEFDPALLRDAIDVGLELCGAPRLAAIAPDKSAKAEAAIDAYQVPELPESWQTTLDNLRPAREPNQPFWEFRKQKPMPVVFRPPATMNSATAHLHLQHPFVRRVLSRFSSQGYSAHDLSRVTVVRTRHDALARVIAFGRLSLFGMGARRLHDQLVSVAARWVEGKDSALVPFEEEADKKALESLEQVLAEAPSLGAVSDIVQQKLVASAPTTFQALWKPIRDEADALAHDLKRKLAERGASEAKALADLIDTQRESILAELARRDQQLTLGEVAAEFSPEEKRQYESEELHMRARLKTIDNERKDEPNQVQDLYKVSLLRLEPVGLVFLWPETRG